jgi:phosphate uptake regulator
MKRKIVQHGSSSLTVTLPSKWAEKFKLKKGDEVDVEESGPILMISTEHEHSSPKKEFSTNEHGLFIKNNLSHLYHLGYDDIIIRYQDNKTLQDIKERIPNCIGFEIIDQKPNMVHIRSIATTLDAEFDTLLRKSFQIINEMAKSIEEAMLAKDWSSLADIKTMENLNNKFTDACLRILNKKGYSMPQRTLQMYVVVKQVERIADEFKGLCDALPQIKNHRIEQYNKVKEYYLAFYSMFYKFDPALKKKIFDGHDQLMTALGELLKKSRGADALYYHCLLNIVEKTYEGSGAYFALTL